VILKGEKRHIIYTWIVLICFIAGQGMVYAHQHLIKSSIHHTHQSSPNLQKITEKCQLCDAMHHNGMLTADHQYFTPIVTTDHFYTPGKYNFTSIALIRSAGRSPPVS
jgi:hypothetical protein